jgi:outer membrane immunogenic protein
MKHAVSALALCAAFIGGPVLAADLPSRKAPLPTYYEPAPIATWTGSYVGLNAGGTFGGSDNIDVTTASLGPGFSPAYGAAGTGTGNSNFGGFIGGGQIGYSYQFSPAVVVGVEADIQGFAGAGSSSFSNASPLRPYPIQHLRRHGGLLAEPRLSRRRARPRRLFVHAELPRLCDGRSRLWWNQSELHLLREGD